MRIGINEVLLYPRSSGAFNREMAVLPEVLKEIEARGGESIVYFSKDLDDRLVSKFIGNADNVQVVKTHLPSIPTYKRVLMGIPYWPKRVLHDGLDVFQTAYYPVLRLKVPTVLTVHDLRYIHMPETYRRARYLFLKYACPLSFSNANRIIAVSKNTRDDLIEYFNFPDNKIDVAHNPILNRYKQITDNSTLSEISIKFHLPPKYILYVGNLELRKNLGRLIQAFELLSKEMDYKLVIVGKPSWIKNRLFKRVRESNLKKKILFTGYVENNDLPALYSLAKLIAFPSLHEGFGIPILEAMACGTPVVTSNVSALPEVAGDAAVLVNPYNVESIANGMARVLKDESLYKDLISKGLRRVKKFKAKDIAVKIVEAYEKALTD